ncbi:protein asteroid [Anopheles nili]|uniref:protein asteroid n=1 Tax=Anopheles nili TaxID=185578 RepID=UPI00237A7B78|nr:protein asteroid [Anopheles nili]
MGVRGLTTFIAGNAELYLKPYELRDTNLVIDGDNLCLQLYQKSQLKSTPLGGNYDIYYRTVVDFFALLKLANVVPYVLLDGGYEPRKMSVVRNRMWKKIQVIKNFSTASIMVTMPLMLREVFVDALQSEGIHFMRCAFEADDEVAILARKLNCPVLSYDSDFYIFDVQYIPYVTLTHKVYRKVTDKGGENFKIGIIQRNQSKKTQRRSKGIKFVAQCGDEDIVEGAETEAYSYIDCCIYTIDNLIAPYDQLSKDMIPLFAVLLGNDYIERSVLAPFYEVICTGRVNRKINRYERRLKVTLKWLQHHTLQSATRAIIKHIKGEHKQTVYRRILTAMRGYNCENCTSLQYFGLQDVASSETLEDDDVEIDLHNCLGNADGPDEECPDFRDVSFLDNEQAVGDGEDATQSQDEDISDDGLSQKSADCSENTDDDTEARNSEKNHSSGEETNADDGALVQPSTFRNKHTDMNWPTWFKEIYRSAKVPRFLVDLLHSNFYLNYPQIEDINQPDSNAISYPILRTIFAILKTSFKTTRTEFTYTTRRVKRSGSRKVLFKEVRLPEGVTFVPNAASNVKVMQKLFEECGIQEWRELFQSVDKNVPANLRLYFLAIIYWVKNCPNVNLAHVHAVIVCMLQLQIIDKALKNQNRDVQLFRQQNQSFLDQERTASKTSLKKTENQQSTAMFGRAFYKQLSCNTPRSELMLAYDSLVEHFALSEKKYDKRATFDVATLHTLACFQSVCYNLYALVPVLGYPFENLRMHALYNSLFAYNVYNSINARKNLLEHARTTVFQYSPTLFTALRVMVEFVEKYLPELANRSRALKTRIRSSKSKSSEFSTRSVKSAPVPLANDWETKADTSDSGGEGFIDENNKFSQLLLAI